MGPPRNYTFSLQRFTKSMAKQLKKEVSHCMTELMAIYKVKGGREGDPCKSLTSVMLLH